MADTVYDMIILGGGPAGYTAALYAARSGLNTLVLERLSAGGQMIQTHQIDNYPGFPEGVDGFTLAQSMQQQAEKFGAATAYGEVTELSLEENPKLIKTKDHTYFAKTVVIATGASPRELGLDEEQAFIGRGVGYCAACDGMFYRGKTVAVVGGGNSAAADALLLSRIAKKVILIHRRDTLRAEHIHHRPLQEAENIEFMWNTTVIRLKGDDKLTGIRVKNSFTGEESEVPVDGLFVSIGRKPATAMLNGQLPLSNGGYVLADETTQTQTAGVYAAGDVRSKPLRQIVTAVADGAVAVHMALEYLDRS